jgi:hypothetical protein
MDKASSTPAQDSQATSSTVTFILSSSQTPEDLFDKIPTMSSQPTAKQMHGRQSHQNQFFKLVFNVLTISEFR